MKQKNKCGSISEAIWLQWEQARKNQFNNNNTSHSKQPLGESGNEKKCLINGISSAKAFDLNWFQIRKRVVVSEMSVFHKWVWVAACVLHVALCCWASWVSTCPSATHWAPDSPWLWWQCVRVRCMIQRRYMCKCWMNVCVCVWLVM